MVLIFTTVELLIAQLEDDIKQFEKRFNQLKKMCRENLQRRNVPVSDVVDALTDLPADDIDEHKMFLKKNIQDLYEAPNHAVLIAQLSFTMNYLSYHLLDYLANEFNLGEVKPEMNLYKSDLKQFRMRTPLKLFCNTQKRFVEQPQDFQKVIAKFPEPSDVDVTLEDVERYRERYACHSLPSPTLRHHGFRSASWFFHRYMGRPYIAHPEIESKHTQRPFQAVLCY